MRTLRKTAKEKPSKQGATTPENTPSVKDSHHVTLANTGEKQNPKTKKAPVREPFRHETVEECPPIEPFALDKVPPFTRPASYEDDLLLSSFLPRKLTWAGEQRKGISTHIADATSAADHLEKADREEFYLAKDIPPPPEIDSSMRVMTKYKGETLVKHWGQQLEDLRSLTLECDNIQRIWDAMAPPSIREATGDLKTATLAHLAESMGLGGGRWIRQFTYGFPLVGGLSQSGVYPRNDNLPPAPSVAGIWEGASKRFFERAAHSGATNATTLWAEACDQVKKGWLGAPLPADTLGNVSTYEKGRADIAFRFGATQGDKLRARDDLRHNCVNLRCTVWTPIKLPTWGHISQMCLNIRGFRKKWAFFKADHESAYKQLPMSPERTNLGLIAIRNPTSCKWMDFPPEIPRLRGRLGSHPIQLFFETNFRHF